MTLGQNVESVRAVSRFGPFFAISTAAGPDAAPMSELAGHLHEHIARSRLLLAARAGVAPAEIGERIAASAVQLGLAARLLSPLLGLAVLGPELPDLRLADLSWREVAGGPVALHWRPRAGRTVLTCEPEPARLAVSISADIAARYRISPHVWQGNLAAAWTGAARALAQTHPSLGPTARRIALAAIARAGWSDRLDADGGAQLPRRRNCCLFYRLPGGSRCPDCVLSRPRPASGSRA